MDVNSNIPIEAPQELIDKYAFRLPGAYKFADYFWPGILISPERIKLMKDFRFHPDDILIASYPKTGTTWVSEVISLIVNDCDPDKIKNIRLHERVPWLELDEGEMWVRFFWIWQLIGKVFGWRRDEPIEASSKRKPRVWFTHLPLELMPTQAIEGGCRIIYVSRNPKDTAVSYFHFHKMARFLGQQKTTWDEFFTLYTSGNVYCGSWFEHVTGFWQLAQINPNMLFLKFEDLKKNFDSEVARMCEFLKIDLSADARQTVAAHCEFANMKENRMTNREGIWLFNHRVSNFMRKGIVGDWKNHFTVAQNELFDEIYKQKMSGLSLGYEFSPS